MTDDWDRRIFDKELKAILDAKLPVSASKITSLQGLAIAHPQVLDLVDDNLLCCLFADLPAH